ncbi:MAG: hypothetical protein D6689_12740 [Deltaproteobacteria bacterium]|nr:MAG: hypothetical protein D6689_12740 [Deltaproteobacteria bacterium]
MRARAPTCQLCKAAMRIRARDRELGWHQCAYCGWIRDLGGLPLEAEASPGGRMVAVRRGDVTDVAIAPAGLGWAGPAVAWLATWIASYGALELVRWRPGAALAAIAWLAPLAVAVAWRHTDRTIRVGRDAVQVVRRWRGRVLWRTALARDGLREPAAPPAPLPTVDLRDAAGRCARIRVRDLDEQRWLATELRDAMTANAVVGAIRCPLCNAELDVTEWDRARGAFNCDYCGGGLVFDEDQWRSRLVLRTDIDVVDPAGLFPRTGVRRTRDFAQAAIWILRNPRGVERARWLLVAVAAIGGTALIAWAGTWIAVARSGVGRALLAGPGFAVLALCTAAGIAWQYAGREWGTARVRVGARTLEVERSVWGMRTARDRVALVALQCVEVRRSDATRSITLVAQSRSRLVEAIWPHDGIDTPRFARELFDVLRERQRRLGRDTVGPRPLRNAESWRRPDAGETGAGHTGAGEAALPPDARRAARTPDAGRAARTPDAGQTAPRPHAGEAALPPDAGEAALPPDASEAGADETA